MFIMENGIMGDSAADDLLGCPPDVQKIVMDKGSLHSARNPAASLVIRIKNAREQCGSVYEGSKGRSKAAPSKGRTAGNWSSRSDPVEEFLADNGVGWDSVADDLRGCPPDVQKLVMERGVTFGEDKVRDLVEKFFGRNPDKKGGEL